MHADLESIVCKFGGVEPFACEKKRFAQKFTDRRTDGRTDDGRRAIALAHSWNELKIMMMMTTSLCVCVSRVGGVDILVLVALHRQQRLGRCRGQRSPGSVPLHSRHCHQHHHSRHRRPVFLHQGHIETPAAESSPRHRDRLTTKRSREMIEGGIIARPDLTRSASRVGSDRIGRCECDHSSDPTRQYLDSVESSRVGSGALITPLRAGKKTATRAATGTVTAGRKEYGENADPDEAFGDTPAHH